MEFSGHVRHADFLSLFIDWSRVHVHVHINYFLLQVPGRLYPIELEYHPVSSTQVLQGEGSSGRSRPERLNPKPYLRIMQGIDAKVCMIVSVQPKKRPKKIIIM